METSRTRSLELFRSIFVREVKGGRRSLLSWLIPAGLLLGLTVSMQPSMSAQGSLFQQKIEMMPKEMLQVFGLSSMDLSNPAAYLAMNFTLVILLGALFAGLLGGAALSREEASHTAELLLTQPVSRTTVVMAKAAAGLVLVLVFELALALIAFGTLAAMGVELKEPFVIASLFIAAGLLHMALYALGLAASVFLRRPRTAPALAMGIVFGTYGLGVVAAIAEKLGALRWLSPFKYADPAEIVREAGMAAPVLMLPVMVLVSLVIATAVFNRKDVHA